VFGENAPPVTSCHYDDAGFTVMIWDTKVGARWIHKRIKRHEVKEESSRLVDDFILCLEEMRGSDEGSMAWECARSDARDRLRDLCDLVGVPAEEVVGSDI